MAFDPSISNSTLERLAQASGLAPILARGAIRRCCSRLGVVPQDITPADLPKLVAELEPVLETYLDGDSLTQSVAALRALRSH